MNIEIPAPHGQLEGILQQGAEDAPFGAIVCHPDPLRGGTMHNKVVFHAAKAFAGLGWPVLRLNFRGIGRSTGSYGAGVGERDDVLAALDYLGHDRVVLAGVSFGSMVALTVGADDERGVALCGLAFPVGVAGAQPLASVQRSTKPKLFVQGEQDELCPPAILIPWVEQASEPKCLQIIPGADHLFTGHIEPLKAAISTYFGALRVE